MAIAEQEAWKRQRLREYTVLKNSHLEDIEEAARYERLIAMEAPGSTTREWLEILLGGKVAETTEIYMTWKTAYKNETQQVLDSMTLAASRFETNHMQYEDLRSRRVQAHWQAQPTTEQDWENLLQ